MNKSRTSLNGRQNFTSMVSRPSCTAVSRSGNIVSSPGNPGGAFSPDAFSSTVCGARGAIYNKGVYRTVYN